MTLEPYVYRATLVRVVDGDTADLELDLGFRIAHALRVRLLGIDAPEKTGGTRAAGEAATRFLGSLLWPASEGRTLLVRTHKDSQTDSFGRYLATLFDGEVNLNARMVEAGHAVTR